MNQSEFITAPKVSAKTPQGVIDMPFTGGAYIFNDMKEIKLSQQGKNKGKYVALVDNEDFEYLNQFKWSVIKGKYTYYARQWTKEKVIRMERVIMNTPKGLENDHIDHNGLNNQKSNLRICSRSQNNANRLLGGMSNYIGVYWYFNQTKTKGMRKRIKAQIQINKIKMHLGNFKTEEEAAMAYDEAAKKYFGEFANLNFKE